MVRSSEEYTHECVENNPSLWSTKRIAVDAVRWLATTTSARILHIFDQACNLVNEREQIISVVSPAVELGPLTLSLRSSNEAGDSLTPFAQWMDLSSAVHITDRDIKVGSLAVAFECADHWDPHVRWEVICSQREEILRTISQLAAFAAQYAQQGSLLDLLPQIIEGKDSWTSTENSSHQKLLAAAQKPASQLRLGIRNNDMGLCREGAARLAGLGIGYTPSGDDFVIGAMYAMRIILPPERSAEIGSAMLVAMMPRTNRLSGMWLEAAAEGKAAEAWHDLLDEVRGNSKTSIARSVERILEVGHTSGADALAGFIAVLSD